VSFAKGAVGLHGFQDPPLRLYLAPNRLATLPQPTLAAASSPIRSSGGDGDRHGLDPMERRLRPLKLEVIGAGVSRKESARVFEGCRRYPLSRCRCPGAPAPTWLRVVPVPAVLCLVRLAGAAADVDDAGVPGGRGPGGVERRAASARRAKRALDDV